MPSTLAWTLPGTWHAKEETAAVRRASETPADLSQEGLDEAALVQASLAGRAGAFDLIVKEHQRAVYHLCYRFVGNHEDASDLSQDVFLRAYRGLQKFRGDSSFGTWLHRIAVNLCLNRVSAKAPQMEPLEERQHVDTRSEPLAERLLTRERARRVRDAIRQLPRKQRATLVLRIYREMSHREIAAVLGSSVGAVKANLFHALGNLKKLLGSEAV